MLSGSPFFDERLDLDYEEFKKATIRLTSECNLSVLDDPAHYRWSKVGPRPKAFIKSLLVLDENRRLTADQALAHSWFTHESYANEFDSLYQHAIKNWRPRGQVFKLIEQIPQPQSHALDNIQDTLLSDIVISRHFAPPSREAPPHNIRETLADSQTWQRNDLLPTISDEYCEAQASQENLIDNSLDQSNMSAPVLLPPPEELGDSMQDLSLDAELQQLMPTYDDFQESEQRSRDGASVELGDSFPYAQQRDYENVGSPPQTPQGDDDSSIVPETPIGSPKKRKASIFETPGTRYVHDQVSQETAYNWVTAKYFADNFTKRRRFDDQNN